MSTPITPGGAGEAATAALEFLDGLAENAAPGQRRVLNPIIIGQGAAIAAERLRAALSASPVPGSGSGEDLAGQIAASIVGLDWGSLWRGGLSEEAFEEESDRLHAKVQGLVAGALARNVSPSAGVGDQSGASEECITSPCRWGGGNDIIWCATCGAEYAYGKDEVKPPCPRECPDGRQIAAPSDPPHPDPAQAAPAQGGPLSVDVQRMDTSRGPDFFVRIQCSGRSVTPYVFRERFKAEYEAAHLAWIFGLREDEPDLMAFDEESHPNDEPSPPSPAQGQSQTQGGER